MPTRPCSRRAGWLRLLSSGAFIPASLALLLPAPHPAAAAPPNVLFIIVDDLNDLPLHPAGKPLVPTPNFDRLAARGVSFTNAHCNDPICAPSRSSMMFGLYPQTSGLYWFEDWRQNAILNTSISLTRHLRDHGYGVFATGKVFHGNQDDPVYAEKGPPGSIGPWPWDGRPETKRGLLPHPAQQYLLEADPDMDYQWEHCFGPLTMIPDYPADPARGIPGYRGWALSGKPWRYQNDRDRDLMPDEQCVRWASQVLSRDHEKPFALFTGLVRTHTPLYAPREYFDRFPLDSIELPAAMANDLEDCAPALGNRELYGFRRYQMLLKHPDRPRLYKQWLQAYMACVSFIDDQVGHILDTLDASPHRDQTLVILTSDHGFHMGEKESIYKQSLWDGGTRIPLIVAGLEGMPAGAVCHEPVSLIDLYPTLNDACALPPQPNRNGNGNGYALDGHSLKPLLLDPEAGAWGGPGVVITALPGKDHSQHREFHGTLYPHFSVRARDWRYSLTSTGEEELYHYASDPHEWKNLAAHPEFAGKKAELKAQLIALRDGARWEALDQLPGDFEPGSFELEAEFLHPSAGPATIRLGTEPLVTLPAVETWTPVRIRVTGKRHQVWIDHRVHSDGETGPATGQLQTDLPPEALRQLRLRRL